MKAKAKANANPIERMRKRVSARALVRAHIQMQMSERKVLTLLAGISIACLYRYSAHTAQSMP